MLLIKKDFLMGVKMRVILFLLFLLTVSTSYSFAGINVRALESEGDHASYQMIAPFDLRDRETFLQITNIDSLSQSLHIQIYNVGNLCNENNFFDIYTPNDTHTYNLRDITTNDGNPSGVVLPENAYGIVFVSAPFPLLLSIPDEPLDTPLIGNIRILNNSGYEYRSNLSSGTILFIEPPELENTFISFNFNSETGINLSDVFGISLSSGSSPTTNPELILIDATIDNVLGTFTALDVDIVDNNEVLFSCRDVVYSCVDENNPLNEEILTLASIDTIFPGSSASVVRSEYGINNAIPHSKGGELLCPGNIIPQGTVILTPENFGDRTVSFFGYVGLNNGNGRGTFETMFFPNLFTSPM